MEFLLNTARTPYHDTNEDTKQWGNTLLRSSIVRKPTAHKTAGDGQLSRPARPSNGAGPSVLGAEGVRLLSALVADGGGSGHLLRLELVAH